MLASYFLSRTLVPTMAKYLLKGHEHDRVEQARASRNPLVRFQIAFEHYFEKLRDWYHGVLAALPGTSRRVSAVDRGVLVRLAGAALSVAGSGFLPVGRRRPVQAACACPHRNAHRRYGAAVRPDRGSDSPRDSRKRTRHDHRQHRPALLGHESLLLKLGSGRHRRRGHSGLAGGKASAHRRIHARAARQADRSTFPAPSSTTCRPTW